VKDKKQNKNIVDTNEYRWNR